MRVKLVERMGVPSVVAIAAAVTILYSLWGASVLHTQRQAASSDPWVRVTTNL